MSTCTSPERAERSYSTIAPGSDSIAISVLRAMSAILFDTLRRIEREHRIRSDARRLHEMPEDALSDIGLARGDIDYAVRHGSLPGERGSRSDGCGIHAPR